MEHNPYIVPDYEKNSDDPSAGSSPNRERLIRLLNRILIIQSGPRRAIATSTLIDIIRELQQ